MITEYGQPVEFFLTPGSYSDTSAYRLYDFDLPQQAWITADKAYNDYDVEDALNETGFRIKPIRKKNFHRPFEPWIFYVQSTYRKMVETAGSLIERLLPKHDRKDIPLGAGMHQRVCLGGRLFFEWAKQELSAQYAALPSAWIKAIRPSKSRMQANIDKHEAWELENVLRIARLPLIDAARHCGRAA